MFDFTVLSQDAQVAIFLLIAEDAINYFSNDDFIQAAQNAINNCWSFIEKKDIMGDDLYDLIDSGEYYDITDLQASSKIKDDVVIWDCVIDSVVYTCRKAYELHNEQLPQAIEIANSDLYEHAKGKYILIDLENCKKIQKIEMYFMNNFKLSQEKELNILELKSIFIR